ncbi:DUF4956 domain-containing protein [Streptococcus loxodontisalivarius]|uniref:DUF4956 domain-containing protein n=1 Tax=Streptococcus loxodontisalivarius TaxID=1349415 RepID=A0ABS2PR81_9STRE|nr:DUF4956 domain-containing protein [Streptococcus loxodontisalivarius]MBM7642004.1 hypothetical protein [Streptococcus loxodontisalivarius]
MSASLFNSVFTTTTTSVNAGMLILALFVSLLLGLALSWVYKYRTLYTREFVITLAILPSLMTLVIFLVNGNLGTSVAVAGVFSLIRFRSATSGSRELLAVFLSMIIGLACGMGYLLLSAATTLILLLIWFSLENMKIIADSQTRRHLTLTVANREDLNQILEKLFANYCATHLLISINSTGSGDQLKLVYEVDLKPNITDFQLSQGFLASLDNLDLALTKQAKKKKNL